VVLGPGALMGEPDDEEAAAREEARLARKERRQRAKRKAILRAARELVVEGGPDALTIAALAARADTSPSTLYYYLPNRDAVIDALAAELVREESEAMLAAMEPVEGGVESLVAVMRTRVALYQEEPDRFAALYLHLLGARISPGVLQAEIYPRSAQVMGELAARLEADQAAGRVHRDLRPREFANVGFFAVQGILATAQGMRSAGGALLFPVETLLDEAVAVIRRAALTSPP
jgi:AcrR family transcriptional regulator